MLLESVTFPLSHSCYSLPPLHMSFPYIVVFKCLKNDAPSYLSSNFIFTSSIHSQGTRSQSFNTLVLPSWYNNSGKRTFQYRGALKWNTLVSDIRSNLTSMNLNMFKSYISNN